MPPFTSSSKAFWSLIANKNSTKFLFRSSKDQAYKFDQIRHSSSVVRASTPSILELIDNKNNNNIIIKNSCSTSCCNYASSLGGTFHNVVNKSQKRQFLGCGDGEEGGVLSKVYEERRVIGYSPEQLFDVVAAVDLYHGFVPWCQRSEIIRHHPDGSFDAELEIGFKFLVESYVSHVELQRPKSVKTTVSDSTLFDHLINIWEFKPGPVPGSCHLYFLVDFKFQSPLYRQVASVFFKEVVSRLVGSFSDRCKLIYGPGVAVFENSYEQKA